MLLRVAPECRSFVCTNCDDHGEPCHGVRTSGTMRSGVRCYRSRLSLYESMNNPKIQDTVKIVSLNIERQENDSDSNNIELDLKKPTRGVKRVQKSSKGGSISSICSYA
jgi:hypothetical protein